MTRWLPSYISIPNARHPFRARWPFNGMMRQTVRLRFHRQTAEENVHTVVTVRLTWHMRRVQGPPEVAHHRPTFPTSGLALLHVRGSSFLRRSSFVLFSRLFRVRIRSSLFASRRWQDTADEIRSWHGEWKLPNGGWPPSYLPHRMTIFADKRRRTLVVLATPELPVLVVRPSIVPCIYRVTCAYVHARSLRHAFTGHAFTGIVKERWLLNDGATTRGNFQGVNSMDSLRWGDRRSRNCCCVLTWNTFSLPNWIVHMLATTAGQRRIIMQLVKIKLRERRG